ncbi:MAG: hypothetical protein ACTSYU_13485 [Promethearchaeota archaeon]
MIVEEAVLIAPAEVVWQIVGISLIMFTFSQWFSRRFKVSQESQMQIQMQVQDLQDQLKVAQEEHNPELTVQLNAEMMEVMKVMYKKQLVPMLIRSVVFFGLFGLMRLLYGGFDEYLPFTFLLGRTLFSLYLLVSLSASLVLFLIRYIMKKINPKDTPKEEVVIDKLRALQSNIIVNRSAEGDNAGNISSYTPTSEDYNGATERREKGWKDRL